MLYGLRIEHDQAPGVIVISRIEMSIVMAQIAMSIATLIATLMLITEATTTMIGMMLGVTGCGIERLII